jgi:hypothetical protein
MRNILFILGALLLLGGVLVASGVMKYEETDKVADFGKLEIEATREKTAPLNWGYVLLGGGVVVLIGAAILRKP